MKSIEIVIIVTILWVAFYMGMVFERARIESALKSQGAVWVGNLTNHGVVQEK